MQLFSSAVKNAVYAVILIFDTVKWNLATDYRLLVLNFYLNFFNTLNDFFVDEQRPTRSSSPSKLSFASNFT